jgi:hypothetical protein
MKQKTTLNDVAVRDVFDLTVGILFTKYISDFVYVRSHCQFIYDPQTPEYYDSDV